MSFYLDINFTLHNPSDLSMFLEHAKDYALANADRLFTELDKATSLDLTSLVESSKHFVSTNVNKLSDRVNDYVSVNFGHEFNATKTFLDSKFGDTFDSVKQFLTPKTYFHFNVTFK